MTNNTMDWPIPADWKCETCDLPAPLQWGIRHGNCTCTVCGTWYSMGDATNMLPQPKNLMVSPKAARAVWEKTGENILNASEQAWKEAYNESA